MIIFFRDRSMRKLLLGLLLLELTGHVFQISLLTPHHLFYLLLLPLQIAFYLKESICYLTLPEIITRSAPPLRSFIVMHARRGCFSFVLAAVLTLSVSIQIGWRDGSALSALRCLLLFLSMNSISWLLCVVIDLILSLVGRISLCLLIIMPLLGLDYALTLSDAGSFLYRAVQPALFLQQALSWPGCCTRMMQISLLAMLVGVIVIYRQSKPEIIRQPREA